MTDDFIKGRYQGMATRAPPLNAFDVSVAQQRSQTGPQLITDEVPVAPSLTYPASSAGTVPEGAIPWPAIEFNPDVPEVPDIPDDAVIIVEHPDGSTDVGIDINKLPKLPEPSRHGRRQARLALQAEMAASEALRQQQAEIFRVTTLRRRRILFLVVLVSDGLFFAASLLYQLLTGGLTSMRRKGLTLKLEEEWRWWLKPKTLTLEEMALSLIVDFIGLAAGLQDKTYLLGLFMILQTIATVLISLRGFSLFLLMRLVELVAAALLRVAVFRYLKLTLPAGDFAQLESMFIGFWSYVTTMTGFCGVLCGRDDGGLSSGLTTAAPSGARTADISAAGLRPPALETPTAGERTSRSGSSSSIETGVAAETTHPPPLPLPIFLFQYQQQQQQQQQQQRQQQDQNPSVHEGDQAAVPDNPAVTGVAPSLAAVQGGDTRVAIGPDTPGLRRGGSAGGAPVDGSIASFASLAVAVPGALTTQQLRYLHQQLLLDYYRQRLRQYQARRQANQQQQQQQQLGHDAEMQQQQQPPRATHSRRAPQIGDVHNGSRGQLRSHIQLMQQQIRSLRQAHQRQQQQQLRERVQAQQQEVVAGAPAAWGPSDSTSTQPNEAATASGVGITPGAPPDSEELSRVSTVTPQAAPSPSPTPLRPERRLGASRTLWARAMSQWSNHRRAALQRDSLPRAYTHVHIPAHNPGGPITISSQPVVSEGRDRDVGIPATTEAAALGLPDRLSSSQTRMSQLRASEQDLRPHPGSQRQMTLGAIAYSGVLDNPVYGTESSTLLSSMVHPSGVSQTRTTSPVAEDPEVGAVEPAALRSHQQGAGEAVTSASLRRVTAPQDCSPAGSAGESAAAVACHRIQLHSKSQLPPAAPPAIAQLPPRNEELQLRLQQRLRQNELLLSQQLQLRSYSQPQPQPRYTLDVSGRTGSSGGVAVVPHGEGDAAVTLTALRTAVGETQLLMQQLMMQTPLSPRSIPTPAPFQHVRPNEQQTAQQLPAAAMEEQQRVLSGQPQQQQDTPVPGAGAYPTEVVDGEGSHRGAAAAALTTAVAALCYEGQNVPDAEMRFAVPLPAAGRGRGGVPSAALSSPHQAQSPGGGASAGTVSASPPCPAGMDTAQQWTPPPRDEHAGDGVGGVAERGQRASFRRGLLQLSSHPILVLPSEAATEEWMAGRAAARMRGESGSGGALAAAAATGKGRQRFEQQQQQQPQGAVTAAPPKRDVSGYGEWTG